MKPININEKNAEKITAALLAANGRANSHTLTRARQIRDIADAANDYLSNLGLSKACMVGAKVSFTSGGDVPNAYKWQRKVTHVHLERRKSGWFLNSIEVIEIWGNAPKTSYLLTCEQDRIVVAKTRSSYLIIPDVVKSDLVFINHLQKKNAEELSFYLEMIIKESARDEKVTTE
jgi:hypothetical protein